MIRFTGFLGQKLKALLASQWELAEEYTAYGYNVGCNKLGNYPFPMDPVKLGCGYLRMMGGRICWDLDG